MIHFVLSVFGFLLVCRKLESLSAEFALSEQLSTKFCAIFLFMIAASAIFTSFNPVMHWIFIGIILICLNIFPTILRFFLLKSMKSRLLLLLDETLLGLQVGQSYRVALLNAIHAQNSWHRRQFLEIYNAITMVNDINNPAKSKNIDLIVREFAEIDRSQSKVVEQVRAFRRQIKVEEDFRRRSGQVMQQIRLQALIVTVMYIALLFFVIGNFSFNEHKMLIFVSALMFFAGLSWIFNVGRRMKWKV